MLGLSDKDVNMVTVTPFVHSEYGSYGARGKAEGILIMKPLEIKVNTSRTRHAVLASVVKHILQWGETSERRAIENI